MGTPGRERGSTAWITSSPEGLLISVRASPGARIGVKRSEVRVTRGHTSRRKVVLVTATVAPEQVAAALGPSRRAGR